AGLKRGFTFLFHRPGEVFQPGPTRERELLVAASPNDRVADTHWYRPAFDAALLDAALAAGADYFDETRIETVHVTPREVRIEAVRGGRSIEIRAGFVVDATGPRGCLVNRLGDGGSPPR